MKVTEAERSKYQKVWGLEDYSVYSPGEHAVDYFFRIAKPVVGQSVIDVGAGSGAASRALKGRGLVVRAFDLCDVAWRHEDIPLLTGSVWRDLPVVSPPYDFAYCTDVMEHIPTEFTALSVSEILRTCGRAFFSIAFTEDGFGDFIGQPLHLTVKPFSWWRDLMGELGTIEDARDQMGSGVFLVRK